MQNTSQIGFFLDHLLETFLINKEFKSKSLNHPCLAKAHKIDFFIPKLYDGVPNENLKRMVLTVDRYTYDVEKSLQKKEQDFSTVLQTHNAHQSILMGN